MQFNFFCFPYLPLSAQTVVKYINLLSYPELNEKLITVWHLHATVNTTDCTKIHLPTSLKPHNLYVLLAHKKIKCENNNLVLYGGLHLFIYW